MKPCASVCVFQWDYTFNTSVCMGMFIGLKFGLMVCFRCFSLLRMYSLSFPLTCFSDTLSRSNKTNQHMVPGEKNSCYYNYNYNYNYHYNNNNCGYKDFQAKKAIPTKTTNCFWITIELWGERKAIPFQKIFTLNKHIDNNQSGCSWQFLLYILFLTFYFISNIN